MEIIVEYLPMGITIVDETLMVRYTNKFFIKMFNMSYSEIVNKGPGDYICCINSFISSQGCGDSEKCNVSKLRELLNNTMKSYIPSESVVSSMLLS